jgi:indolepyruvate ferredoxin oxidoreductase
LTQTSQRPSTADPRYGADGGTALLTGVQALVRGPLDHIRADRAAGRSTGGFISGYPGSPLAGLDRELISRRELLTAERLVHQPGLNEELAATSVMGTQLAAKYGRLNVDSLFGIWYGKAPGLDRSGDALRHAPFWAPTYGHGAVAYVGDDPGCKSSTIPSNSVQALADLDLVTLYPGTTQEVLDFVRHALALSRACGLWAAIKVDSSVADGSGTVELGTDRIRPQVDGAQLIISDQAKPAKRLYLTVAAEREINDYRIPAARQYAVDNGLNVIRHPTRDAWLGILAAGPVYYEMMLALKTLGLEARDLERFGVRILHIAMLHPLEPHILAAFAQGLDEILVIEDKRPFLESALRSALYGQSSAPRIYGKRGPDGAPLVPSFGWLDADALMGQRGSRLREGVDPGHLKLPKPARPATIALKLISRTPYFCSGCPHNTSLKAPAGSKVAGGIGCHSMVVFLDKERRGDLTGLTQMGGEGMQWVGAAPFVDTAHIFQNLGDGTYFHSAQLAVQAAVAAGVNITYKILNNRTVAMTGGQDAPGALPVPDMAEILARQGVARIIITAEDKSRYKHRRLPAIAQLWDREQIVEAQEALAATPGVTVLIHDQQCAAEARRLRKRGQLEEPKTSVIISERVCEGCGDCGAYSNCLSLQPVDTEFGEKTAVDQTSCNKDYSCLHGDCPAFVTTTPAKPGRRARARADSGPTTAAVDVAGLPAPAQLFSRDDFRMRMPGIGGTGVVTVAQIISRAAALDGLHVSSLDQTGLAQKGGAVVSDVHISTSEVIDVGKSTRASLDLYLVFDLISALAPATVDAASPTRTVAIASTTKQATGAMIGRPDVRPPATSTLTAELDKYSRADLNRYLDADAICRAIFGQTTGANLFMVGVAYQSGALPLSAHALEAAIEANRVDVDGNIAAFRWGRLFAARPEEVLALLPSAAPARPGRRQAALAAAVTGIADRELADFALRRAVDLADYQDLGYARRYLGLVTTVAQRESQVQPASVKLTWSVARYLYKLMAYKDEYEVARLHLLDEARRRRQPGNEPGSTVTTWHLHPPVLRSLGMKRKLRLRRTARPAFRLLRAMKRLRGTAFDPFGYAEVRRCERGLVTEYEQAIARLLPLLTAENLALFDRIAQLPGLVRGYEDIKMRNVARYHDQVAQATAELLAPTPGAPAPTP